MNWQCAALVEKDKNKIFQAVLLDPLTERGADHR